jgi:iron(III) transport system permease protein
MSSQTIPHDEHSGLPLHHLRKPMMQTVLEKAESLLAVVIFAVTFAAVLLPVGYVFYGSVRSDSPGAPEAEFTFQNWITVYASEHYLTALGNTCALAGLVAVLSLIIGGILAWIIARTDAPWRNQLALFLVVPLMISNLITALAWVALAAPNAGLINVIARKLFGIETLFDIYSFSGIALVLTLHYSSFAFLNLYAALRSVDASLEEASYMLGGGPLRTGLKMTFPLIWPTIAASFLIIFVFVTENFSVPTLLGSPVGFFTLPSQIYVDMAVDPVNPPLAAVSGTMLLWIAVIGIVWQRRIIGRANRYVTIAGKGSRTRLTNLGPWKYAAVGFIVVFLGLGAVLPYFVLLLGSFLGFVTSNLSLSLFTLENYVKLFSGESLLSVRNSLVLAGVGGLAATLFYAFLSHLIKQLPKSLGGLVDYLTIIPTAIPALVLGIGLIWAFVGMPLPIYGTMAILVIAYFTRFIGYGVRHSRAALVQISDELTEAARISGASPLRAFRNISLPLIRPSLLSLWTMLFIFIFMEISATILLYSPKTVTLPVNLWNYMSSGYQTRAYAVAVVQATIIFAILYVTNRLFGTLKSTLDK